MNKGGLDINGIYGVIEALEEELVCNVGERVPLQRLEDIRKTVSSSDGTDDLFVRYISYEPVLSGKKAIELFEGDDNIAPFSEDIRRAYRESYMSVFEVMDGKKGIVRDMFRREDLSVQMDREMVDGSVIVGRIFDLEKKIIGPGYSVYGGEYKSVIYSGVYAKFREFEIMMRAKGDMDIQDVGTFILQNPEVLLRYMAVIVETEVNQLWEDEELDVYVAVYVFGNRIDVLKKLMESKRIGVLDHEDDMTVMTLFTPDGYDISELVISGNKLELESRSSEELEAAMKELEKLLGDSVAFLEQDVVSIESLI